MLGVQRKSARTVSKTIPPNSKFIKEKKIVLVVPYY